MAVLTVRNISAETHRALKLRASQHGRSVEAEVRRILSDAVTPATGLGTELAAFWDKHADFDLQAQRTDEPPRIAGLDA